MNQEGFSLASMVGSYLPADRRQALARGQELEEHVQGAALFADLSGFTRLTDSLRRSLGPRRSAEQLAYTLNLVYDALIAQVDLYGGSVIGFSGDAITCWFDDSHCAAVLELPEQQVCGGPHRAVTCGLEIQRAIREFVVPGAPGQEPVELQVKVAVASGGARRFLVGDPRYQMIEVSAGATVSRMAAAEQLAGRGETVVDQATVDALQGCLEISEWRGGEAGGQFAVVRGLLQRADPAPWPALTSDVQEVAAARAWLQPLVYERLSRGLGEFLTELRPAAALFLRFGWIDYETDPQAGKKLDQYVRWVQGVLASYGGSLIQLTIGEKGSYLYAAFGAPQAHDDDIWRAASTALALRLPPAELSFIDSVQIGISQGTMRTGAYGSRTRRTYGVLGDDVNLAARLMQTAGIGEILVSGHVRDALGQAGEWGERQPVMLKGKDTPVPVAALEGLDRRKAGAIAYTGEIVGRQIELNELAATLRPMFAPVENGRFAGVVTISGEVGMGKSRLVHELQQRLGEVFPPPASGEKSFQWFYCPADPILRQSLNPFKNFLRQYFVQSADSTVDENRERFGHILDSLIDKLVRPEQQELRLELERTRSFLGALVDLHWSDSLYERLEPKQRFENTLLALQALVLAESQVQPVILHVEDAHWLDGDSQELLKALARNAGNARFTILLSGRTCENEAADCFDLQLDGIAAQKTLVLKDLPPPGVWAMAVQVLSADAPEADLQIISDDLGSFLVEKTGGNPFFLEQLLLGLRERGLIALRHDCWELVSAGAEEVPAGINAILISRLDRLGPDVRATVQTASVLGSEFEEPVLRSILTGQDRLTGLIREAESRQIWLRAAALRCLFRQSLLRNAAYEMLPHMRVQELHALAALSIERVHAADLEPYYADLAHHYDQAQQTEKAFIYAWRAGERAASQYANRQAIDHLERALGLAADLDAAQMAQPLARIHTLLGEVSVTTGQYAEAQQHLEEALALADGAGDADGQARACRWLARLHELRSEYAQALSWIEDGLGRLDGRETPETAELLSMAGLISSRQGDSASAQAYAERAAATAAKLGDSRAQARATNLLGLTARLRGEGAAAVQYFERSLELYSLSGDINGQARAHNLLGTVYFNRQDWQVAKQHFLAARQLAEAMGDIYLRAMIDNNLGWIALAQGKEQDALKYYRQGLAAMNQIGGSLYVLGAFHNNLGAVFIRLKNVDLANEHLRASQEYFDRAGARDWLPELNRHKALAALLAGDWEQAESRAQAALLLAQELKMRNEEGSALRVLGEIAAAAGQVDQAQAYFHQSLAVLAEAGDEYGQAQTRLALARMLFARGNRPETLAALEPCLPVLEHLGAETDLAEARVMVEQVSVVG